MGCKNLGHIFWMWILQMLESNKDECKVETKAQAPWVELECPSLLS